MKLWLEWEQNGNSMINTLMGIVYHNGKVVIPMELQCEIRNPLCDIQYPFMVRTMGFGNPMVGKSNRPNPLCDFQYPFMGLTKFQWEIPTDQTIIDCHHLACKSEESQLPSGTTRRCGDSPDTIFTSTHSLY